MIKDKLMRALKTAAADYNNGMSANAAVAKTAGAYDFNEKQAERLVEMFNTLAAINKEKDASDPTGSCELASKEAVAKMLLDGCGTQKAASAPEIDYSFYHQSPEKTNPTMEARRSGMASMCKAAFAEPEKEPAELNVSQRSLYKMIEGRIDMLKAASAAADDVARNLRLEIERESIKVAKAIEDPWADPELADMFKAACQSPNAMKSVSEYSTKVAESDGGRFAKVNVFDSSKVDDLLKAAESIESNISMIPEYEGKRDFFMSKAAEAHNEILKAVGLESKEEEGHVGLADMFHGVQRKEASSEVADGAKESEDIDDAGMCVKIAELLRETGVSSEEVAKIATDLEKDAAPGLVLGINRPSVEEAHRALSKINGIDNERKRMMNVRRSILLSDLMANDPIIRDADPETVAEAYKTMVMTSPRVSLDKSQVRAFLRSAVNSVAISPSDAKVLGEVDKWTSYANVDRLDRLTSMDSSIKDSNA